MMKIPKTRPGARLTRLRRTVQMSLALAAIGAIAVGCSSSKAANNSTTASPGVHQARATVSEMSKPVTSLDPNGPAFNALPATQGKTIGVVAGTTVDPGFFLIVNPMKQAAALLGMTVHICDGNNFSVSAETACMSQFTTQHVNVMVLQSIDPRTVQAPLAAVHNAGIPVVTSNAATEGAPLAPDVSAQMSFPYLQLAQLEATSFVALSGGTSQPLLITSSDYVNSAPMENVIKDTLAKLCGAKCAPIVRDVPLTQWSTQMTPLTQSAVQSNPNIHYIIPLFDTALPYINAALAAANATTRVQVISAPATPGIPQFMTQRGSSLVVDIGSWQGQLGWAMADAAARLLAGQRNNAALRDAKIAVRILNRVNVTTLNLKQPNTWYGNLSLEAFYKKQWELK
jgi:ribose transport system substrate-binding protein